MEDHQIIALYFERNNDAIRETDIKYGKLCYSVADGILHLKEDNEECVNSTYLAAWNAMPPQRPTYLSAFLCRITRNISLKKLKSNNAQKRGSELEVSLSELEEILPSDSDVHAMVEAKELGEAISKFLYTLPRDSRNIFIQRYFMIGSVKEIAKNFHWSSSKVKSRLARMRVQLYDYLKKEKFI